MGDMAEYYGAYEPSLQNDASDDAPTWMTRDGRTLLMSEMYDQHLENTIRFLERRGVCTEKERASDPIRRTEAKMCGVSEMTIKKYEQLLEEKERRAKVSSSDHAKPRAR